MPPSRQTGIQKDIRTVYGEQGMIIPKHKVNSGKEPYIIQDFTAIPLKFEGDIFFSGKFLKIVPFKANRKGNNGKIFDRLA